MHSESAPKRAQHQTSEYPLTTDAIAAARHRQKPYSLPAKDGLYLWITPSAGKLWRWNYQFDGQTRIIPYGEWPKISLERARAEHMKARRYLDMGIDPMIAKRAAERRAKYLRIGRQEERSLLKVVRPLSNVDISASPPIHSMRRLRPLISDEV